METLWWNVFPFGFLKKCSVYIVTVIFCCQLVCGGNYVEQYLNSPEICPPISSGFFSQHLNLKQKIRLVNFPNYTMVVKLSRWQERNSPSAHLNFACTFEVTAPKGYGVMVTVRSLHLRRNPNPGRSRYCRDFLRFKQKDSKILTDVCGEVDASDNSEFPENLTGPRFFYDPRAEMYVSIQTDDTVSDDTLKPLTIELIFTAYHSCSPGALAEGRVKPCSQTSLDSCIDANLFCDDHVNCGIDEFGIDEVGCEEKTGGTSRSTTLVIFGLTAVGTLILAVICALITCCCCKRCGKKPATAPPPTSASQRRTSSSAGLNVTHPISPTAPIAELNEMPVWRANTPTAPKAEVEDDDLPPSYKDLFPVHQADVIIR